MYKVVICLSVCLFVCPIITHKPLDRFDQNFVWGTRKNDGNVQKLNFPARSTTCGKTAGVTMSIEYLCNARFPS